MTIEYQGDMVLFKMNTPETAQVMWQNGLIHSIHQTIKSDRQRASEQHRPVETDLPITVCTEERGLVHVLRCKLTSWPYFREVEAVNPSEREIRAEMMRIGLMGSANRLGKT